MLFQGWLVARSFGFVGDHHATLSGSRFKIPPKILLDSHREARRKSTVEPVLPLAAVRITVVRIHDRPAVIQKRKLGLLGSEEHHAQQPDNGSSHPLFRPRT